jgi:arylsulfatase A
MTTMRPLLLSLLSSFILLQPAAAAEQPNVVIIFMDDMGYADVSCFGAQGYQTPNIDKLAADGPQVHQLPCRAAGVQRLTLRAADGMLSEPRRHSRGARPSAKHGINADEMTSLNS